MPVVLDRWQAAARPSRPAGGPWSSGRLARPARRGRQARLAARDRLALAEHRGRMLRRAQQQRDGWLEAHDGELRRREQLVARELAWRRRVDERAMALDPPGWLVAELGPVPKQPAEREAWIAAAVELDAYRRVHGLPDRAERTEQIGGPSERDTDAVADREPARDGRRPRHMAADRDPPGGPAGLSRPAPEEPSGPARPASRPVPGRAFRPAPDRRGWHRRQRDRDDTAQDRPAGPFGPVLGSEPGRDQPGQRRDWHAVRAALDRLADQRERLRRGDRQDQPGHRDRDRPHRQDSDRHERDGR